VAKTLIETEIIYFRLLFKLTDRRMITSTLRTDITSYITGVEFSCTADTQGAHKRYYI